jgi:dolichol kinase
MNMSETATATPLSSQPNISYTQELLRKSIHLCSLSIPIIYSFITRELAIVLLGGLFALALALDLTRWRVPAVNQFIGRYFARMMRPHELDDEAMHLNGATYVLMSALLCVIVFPKIIAITGFTILIVSDISSALIGRKFGTIRFLDKSLQGTAAFVVSAWCVVGVICWLAAAPPEYLMISGVAAVVGGIAEAASTRLRMDDNLSIPLSIGLVMWGWILLLPAITQNVLLNLLLVR